MIILLNGLSGSGKSAIAQELLKNNPDEYNIVQSYTTRQRRSPDDNDHTFISKRKLIRKMLSQNFIARTEIDGNIYCAFDYQFKKDKVNIYIVDDFGIIDVINFHPNDSLYIIRVKGQHQNVDEDRKNRFEHIIHDDCQFIDLILENSEEITISELASEIEDFVKEKK